MSSILIHLIDGTPGGRIELEPSGSIIKALRVSRDQARDPAFDSVLSHHGIYIYLFPDHTVYVGQASVQSLRDRIFGHHTDGYEQLWSHVVVFACCSDTVNRSEFDYLENALCEYAYGHLSCINRSPSKTNCNQTFRSSHYGLTLYARAQCENWSQEIIGCLGAFDMGLFPSCEPVLPPPPPPPLPPPPPPNIALFRHNSGYEKATAEIQDYTKKRIKNTTIKAGTQINPNVKASGWTDPNAKDRVINQRNEARQKGILVNGVLQKDYPPPDEERFTASFAAEFIAGRPVASGDYWQRDGDNVKLKDLFE